MNAKLAGWVFGLGMVSLSAQAETLHFTALSNATNPVLESLGNQLTLDVTSGGANNVLLTFTNSGAVDSSIARVYVDDSPSNLFSNIAVSSQSSGVSFSPNLGPGNLPGGNAPTVAFSSTNSFGSQAPVPQNGVNQAGEFLTLSATLNAGKTFADVISSLAGGNGIVGDFLRIGAHVISITGLNDGSASFIDDAGPTGGGGGGGGGSPPPPVPEPETYGMLMAGLGLMAAMVRRRKTGT